MATLEALWQGLPVLITRECNFRDIEALECTFLIEPSIASIRQGIVDLLSRPSRELHARGRCGAEFVQKHFSWQAIGHKMADVYDWMRGGPFPASVEIVH
jgi:glycosyltransferase involved in cell wall biosynthesis